MYTQEMCQAALSLRQKGFLTTVPSILSLALPTLTWAQVEQGAAGDATITQAIHQGLLVVGHYPFKRL